MSACIRCGSAAGEEYRFAHVETNTVFEKPKGGGRQKKIVTEKLPGAQVDYYNTKADLVAALTGKKRQRFRRCPGYRLCQRCRLRRQ